MIEMDRKSWKEREKMFINSRTLSYVIKYILNLAIFGVERLSYNGRKSSYEGLVFYTRIFLAAMIPDSNVIIFKTWHA